MDNYFKPKNIKMNKNIKGIAFALLCMTMVIACSKKSSNPTPSTTSGSTTSGPTGPANTSAATVGGNSYSTKNQIILPTDTASLHANYNQGNFPSLDTTGNGYVSMMGSYPFSANDTLGGGIVIPATTAYAYIFSQAAVTSSKDTITWGFTIASLGLPISERTYNFVPSLADD